MDLFGRGIQQPTSKQTSSLSTIQFLWCQFEEFGIESIFNPQIDIFTSLLRLLFIDLLRRNSALVKLRTMTLYYLILASYKREAVEPSILH